MCPCSYSGTGLQAVLELYFAPFLYVCSGVSRAKKLSTTSVNIYIALYQLCALSAGFLADKIFGEYWHAPILNFVSVAYDYDYTLEDSFIAAGI